MLNCRTLFFTLLVHNTAYAVAENGTGSPSVRMAVDENQRVVLVVQDGDIVLQGGQTTQQGYALLALNAYLQDQVGVMLHNAAYAEVLLGCGEAQVIIYHQVQEEWMEYRIGTVAVDVCVQ